MVASIISLSDTEIKVQLYSAHNSVTAFHVYPNGKKSVEKVKSVADGRKKGECAVHSQLSKKNQGPLRGKKETKIGH